MDSPCADGDFDRFSHSSNASLDVICLKSGSLGLKFSYYDLGFC